MAEIEDTEKTGEQLIGKVMEEATKCNPPREAKNPGPPKHALYEQKGLVVATKLKTVCSF